MAAVIRVTCCDCDHDVTVPAARVSLLCAAGVTTYGFECPRPECRAHVIRVASTSALAALAAGGVKPRIVPLSRPEIAGQPPAGPPISEDDLIALGLELYGVRR